MASAREYLGGQASRRPDDVDHKIFDLLNQGIGFDKIGKQLVPPMKGASVEKRVHRLQAKRWATADGRLLTFGQRDALLAWERTQFPNPD